MNEKMIIQIVDQVYKTIQSQSSDETMGSPLFDRPMGCRLPDKTTEHSFKTMVFMSGEWSKQYEPLKDHYNLVLFDHDITDYDRMAYDTILIPKLNLQQLANLALGTYVSNHESFILHALLNQKEVYLLEKGMAFKKFKETAPKNLYNQYLNYEETLRNYGVKIIKDLQDILGSHRSDNRSDNEKTSTMPSENKEVMACSHKKVITEADLKNIYYKGNKWFVIEKNSIITPLAMDFIKKHHLKIDRI